MVTDIKCKENENEEQFIWRLGQAKDSGELDMQWDEIAQVINSTFREDESEYRSEAAYRKPYQQAKRFFESGVFKGFDGDSYLAELQVRTENLRKERIKTQTLNVERNRVDRSQSRQELFYEYVGSVCNTLPLPEFHPLYQERVSETKSYVMGLADVHYGATFSSVNNEYSPTIAANRFESLTGKMIDFINDKKLHTLTVVSLGDLIQGCLRLSDLKINDSTIVKSLVEVCHLIANMLNELSKYCEIEYYHTPSANHTQIRVLGAKASELADEDLEYLMGHYIKDLCIMNDRIHTHLANDGDDFIEVHIPGNEIIAMHGHQIQNINESIRDLSVLHKKFYDCVLLGHFHKGKEIPNYEGVNGDAEILICPSFVGSDPYSDKICKGAKSAVKVFGIDRLYGHTETYKFILN